MTSNSPYVQLASRLGGELVRVEALKGGVSASVHRLEVARSDGRIERVVVRSHDTTGNKRLEAGVTSTEYALLRALRSAEMRVPEALLLDETCDLSTRASVAKWRDGDGVVYAAL